MQAKRSLEESRRACSKGYESSEDTAGTMLPTDVDPTQTTRKRECKEQKEFEDNAGREESVLNLPAGYIGGALPETLLQIRSNCRTARSHVAPEWGNTVSLVKVTTSLLTRFKVLNWGKPLHLKPRHLKMVFSSAPDGAFPVWTP